MNFFTFIKEVLIGILIGLIIVILGGLIVWGFSK